MPAEKVRSGRWSRLLIASVVLLTGIILYGLMGWRTMPAFGDPVNSLAKMEQLIAQAPLTLVIAAHPDDVEWYVGGTVARLTTAGARVTIVMATNGEKGRGPQPGLGDVRRAEQEEAARRLGIADVLFLDLPDGGLRRIPDTLTAAIETIWRDMRPELVLAFDSALPRPPYIHPDHQAAGRAAAVLHSTELGSNALLLLFHSRRPSTLVDISPVIDRKIDALSAHRTQGMAQGMGQGISQAHRGMAGQLGELGGVAYAEAFRKVTRGSTAANGRSNMEQTPQAQTGGPISQY